jgi:hypothetical protein
MPPTVPLAIRLLPALALAACSSAPPSDDRPDAGRPGGRADAGPAAPDAGSSADCLMAASYPGTLFEARAFEGNPNNPQARFLALNGNLEAGALPDRLIVVKFHGLAPVGYPTGTFTIPADGWSVAICANFDPDSFRTCAETFEARSGTLRITQTSGRLVGAVESASFPDETDPSCPTAVLSTSFDLPID